MIEGSLPNSSGWRCHVGDWFNYSIFIRSTGWVWRFQDICPWVQLFIDVSIALQLSWPLLSASCVCSVVFRRLESRVTGHVLEYWTTQSISASAIPPNFPSCPSSTFHFGYGIPASWLGLPRLALWSNKEPCSNALSLSSVPSTFSLQPITCAVKKEEEPAAAPAV
jgi:hypothetical protein